MTRLRLFLKPPVFCLLIMTFSTLAHAENPVRDVGIIAVGASKVVGGVLALPVEILKGSTQSFPLGILAGAVRGTFRTLGGVFGGAFDMARGAAPYAKYAAFV